MSPLSPALTSTWHSRALLRPRRRLRLLRRCSLQSKGPCDVGLSQYLAPPLQSAVASTSWRAAGRGEADHKREDSGSLAKEVAAEKESQHAMLKVTGLGQLARLIELGCNVGLSSPGINPSALPSRQWQ